MKQLEGISASGGITIARAYKLIMPDLSFKKRKIVDSDREIKRLVTALNDSVSELRTIQHGVSKDLGAQNAQIFKIYIAILTDHQFVKSVKRQIRYDKLNAEWALDTISKNLIRSLASHYQKVTDHPAGKKARDRINYVRDATLRVLSHLRHRRLPNLLLIKHPVIIVAHDLIPSDVAQLNMKYVKGLVADLGGKTAHSAIMAKTVKIPAVVGVRNATRVIHNHDRLIVDGSNGSVVINPDHRQVVVFKRKIRDYRSKLHHLKYLKRRQTISKDGYPLAIATNITGPNNLRAVLDNGSEGIGLYRTEFLFMNSTKLPTEEQQFLTYRKVVVAMHGRPVTFRTLDIGGDKQLPYLQFPKEANPFLGYRGIRYCLSHPALFKAQLRALLRVSAYGPISIIFPMISTVQDFFDARSIYVEEREQLLNRGFSLGHIDLGIMIETPAAAIMADKLARQVDLVNIGTNDLVQFVMAADRGNNLVANLYLPYDPSVIRLIKHVVDCVHREHKKVCICGEMAASPIAIPLFLGMGVDQLSMNVNSILKSRSLVNRLNARRMRKLVHKVVRDATGEKDVIRWVYQATVARK